MDREIKKRGGARPGAGRPVGSMNPRTSRFTESVAVEVAAIVLKTMDAAFDGGRWSIDRRATIPQGLENADLPNDARDVSPDILARHPIRVEDQPEFIALMARYRALHRAHQVLVQQARAHGLLPQPFDGTPSTRTLASTGRMPPVSNSSDVVGRRPETQTGSAMRPAGNPLPIAGSSSPADPPRPAAQPPRPGEDWHPPAAYSPLDVPWQSAGTASHDYDPFG